MDADAAAASHSEHPYFLATSTSLNSATTSALSTTSSHLPSARQQPLGSSLHQQQHPYANARAAALSITREEETLSLSARQPQWEGGAAAAHSGREARRQRVQQTVAYHTMLRHLLHGDADYDAAPLLLARQTCGEETAAAAAASVGPGVGRAVGWASPREGGTSRQQTDRDYYTSQIRDAHRAAYEQHGGGGGAGTPAGVRDRRATAPPSPSQASEQREGQQRENGGQTNDKDEGEEPDSATASMSVIWKGLEEAKKEYLRLFHLVGEMEKRKEEENEAALAQKAAAGTPSASPSPSPTGAAAATQMIITTKGSRSSRERSEGREKSATTAAKIAKTNAATAVTRPPTTTTTTTAAAAVARRNCESEEEKLRRLKRQFARREFQIAGLRCGRGGGASPSTLPSGCQFFFQHFGQANAMGATTADGTNNANDDHKKANQRHANHAAALIKKASAMQAAPADTPGGRGAAAVAGAGVRREASTRARNALPVARYYIDVGGGGAVKAGRNEGARQTSAEEGIVSLRQQQVKSVFDRRWTRKI